MSETSPLVVPPGWGFAPVPKREWTSTLPDFDPLMGKLLLFEPPRAGYRYVISADVAEGVNQDRSSVDVIRVGTISSPDEQVAHFISDEIDPIDLAHVIDTLGRFYKDADNSEALVAIEVIGPGNATQSEMQRHLGYSNFWVWQWEDVRPDRNRYSSRIGWVTNQRSRQIAMSRLLKSLHAILTPDPWILINSPYTIAEMNDLQTEGATWEAAAALGAHDDCIMSIAIGIHVCQTLHFEDGEPVAEARARKAEEQRRREEYEAQGGEKKDFYNSPVTLAEMDRGSVAADGASWFSDADLTERSTYDDF